MVKGHQRRLLFPVAPPPMAPRSTISGHNSCSGVASWGNPRIAFTVACISSKVSLHSGLISSRSRTYSTVASSSSSSRY